MSAQETNPQPPKRPHPHPQDAHPPKRRKPNPHHQHQHHRPDRPNPHKPAPKPNAINPLKSRLRDVTRLLARKADNMPAPQLLSLQREEQNLRHEIEGISRKDHRSKMIAKWHKVRFFERRKAERRLGRAERELKEGREGATGEDLEEREEEVRRRKVDLNYALYFPLEQDYERLYGKSEGGEEKVQRGEMWKVVERAMKEGRLEALREQAPAADGVDERDGQEPESGRRYNASEIHTGKVKTKSSKGVTQSKEPGKQTKEHRFDLDREGDIEEDGTDDEERGEGFFE